jgi:Phage tail tube protein
MPAQRVAGTAYFLINGIQQSMRGSGKFDGSMVKREEIVNIDGSINFKETPKAGKAELDLTTIPGVSISGLNQITNSPVTFVAANGTSYTLNNGFQVDDLNVDIDEGKVQVKFAGVVIETPAI